MVGGLLTLAGWAFEVPRLTNWAGTSISMLPNTAVCAMTAGTALILLALGAPHLLTAVLGACVTLIGAATLTQHATGVDWGIDRLLLFREWGQTGATVPGRMGIPACISWMLLGTALVLARGTVQARRSAMTAALVVASVSILSLVGYIFGATPLYSLPRYTTIAFQTATITLALALGMVMSLPGHEPMKTLMGATTSSSLARRALPLIFLVPLLVGWLRIRGQEVGLFDMAFGTALRTLTEIALLLTLVWWALRRFARTEEALGRAKEVAEAASLAKDRFIAQLSHELRTPLNPVLMTAAALREDSRLPAEVRADLAMIERNIQLEARLIEDLLDLTRITQGKLTLRNELCDAHSLIAFSIDMIEEEAKAKRVAIQLDLTASRRHLTGDPARLQQVFWNLLRNAVKFTQEGGQVRVHTHNGTCEKQCADPGHRVCIAVSDNGIGFEPGEAAQLFEPFHQSAAQSSGGLGLGLAIVKAVVDLHHGRIHAESPGPGRGATFTVELPGEESTVPNTSAPPTEVGELGPEPALSLLLVEDHEPTMRVLSRLLSRAGHHVTTASSVAEALAAAHGQRLDFVVSDLGLPDGTGFDLMKDLRHLYGLRGLALSGYGMEDDLHRSEQAGFVGHLIKPVNLTELRHALRRFNPPAAVAKLPASEP